MFNACCPGAPRSGLLRHSAHCVGDMLQLVGDGDANIFTSRRQADLLLQLQLFCCV